MRLRHTGWVALFGILLIGPAVAHPAEAPEPKLEAAAASPATPPANSISSPTIPAAAAPAGTESSPDSTTPMQDGAEPAALQVPAAEPEPPKPVITLKVSVDLSAQRMTVMNGDEVLHRWPISSGRSGYHTPTGTWQPQWRAKMWRSKQYYGAPMPYSVFYYRGYAVHGTYATGMLGRPASHGCIRLAPKHAKIFYELVGKHGMESTQIVVHGKTPSTARVAKSRNSVSRTRQASRKRAPRGYATYSYNPPWLTW